MRTSKLSLVGAALFCFLGLTAPQLRAQTFTAAGDAGHGSINADGTNSLTGTNTTTGATPDTGVKKEAMAMPLTWKAVGTGGSDPTNEGMAAVDGVNHDYFVLDVPNPAAFAGKVVIVSINWENPATDYDLYIHGGAENGPIVGTSAGGAPGTEETVAISPATTLDTSGNPYTVYYCNADYFTVADSDLPTDTNLPYIGTAVVAKTLATTTTQTYNHGETAITFSPNTPCKSPTAAQQGEPASRIDPAGHYYISGIEGVPAGVDLWYFDLDPNDLTFDPLMSTPQYRGMPDSLTMNPAPAPPGTLPKFGSGGAGGGDVDVAVGFGNYNGLDTTATVPALAMSSLTAANVTAFRSLDLGQTFTKNVVNNALGGVPVNDRQWMQFYGDHDVYLEYRNFAEGLGFIQLSVDGGLTYNPATLIGTLPQTGYIDVDQTDGTVYVGANDGSVHVGTPTITAGVPVLPAGGFTAYQATASTTPANIFFCTRVAQHDFGAAENSLTKAQRTRLKREKANAKVDGIPKKVLAKRLRSQALTYAHNTVYAVYSDGKNIFMVYSLDQAKTWSNPVQVNDPSDTRTKTNLLPWFAPGPIPGTLGIVWYGCAQNSNADTSKYQVFYAYATDANTDRPNFDIAVASDHFIHAANISLNGLSVTGQSPNRNLIDYFQVQFDTFGAAVIGYTDDHNDFQGFTYVMREQTGTSASTGAALPDASRTPGADLASVPATQPAQPGPNGEQVTDYSQDEDSALLAVTLTDSPIDIKSIKYQGQELANGPVILATMKVSGLSPTAAQAVNPPTAGIPPDSTWQMYFTANAPMAGTLVGPPNSQYSSGLSDRGDQFFVQAVTSGSGATTVYQWGSVVRTFSGSLTTTIQGTADSGSFNRAEGTISVRVSAAKLNAFLDSELAANGGPDGENPARYSHIAAGTVMCGLRGEAFEENTSGGLANEDATRGGTEFIVP
jgi:hypothetical protein